jgi:iron complex transport system substrate-binding protein
MAQNCFFDLMLDYRKPSNPVFSALLLALLVGTPHAGAQINVIDSENRTVTLEQPTSRIISLAPYITELLFELGAQNRLIATSEYSDYPPEAINIERIGGYNSVNLERIVALAPDLIIFWGAGNSRSSLNRLLELGYTVYIDDPRKLADIPHAMQNFAVLAGVPEAGEQQADVFNQRLESLQPSIEPGGDLVDVFYQVWDGPLQTLNGEHIVSEIIEFCGGRNIFADEPVIAPVVNLESIIQRNPSVIILGADDATQAVWRKEWGKFTSLKALSNDQVYSILPDYLQRQTSRILEGVGQICNILREAE